MGSAEAAGLATAGVLPARVAAAEEDAAASWARPPAWPRASPGAGASPPVGVAALDVRARCAGTAGAACPVHPGASLAAAGRLRLRDGVWAGLPPALALAAAFALGADPGFWPWGRCCSRLRTLSSRVPTVDLRVATVDCSSRSWPASDHVSCARLELAAALASAMATGTRRPPPTPFRAPQRPTAVELPELNKVGKWLAHLPQVRECGSCIWIHEHGGRAAGVLAVLRVERRRCRRRGKIDHDFWRELGYYAYYRQECEVQ